ncbi:MAG: filamentous hemagglutinin N-terminal domain-containing protein [Proteobacteria bacterium]|nr:filamentous hemagglutinin N-terminal domain-containing protein [Pseudomonadota bacterium]
MAFFVLLLPPFYSNFTARSWLSILPARPIVIFLNKHRVNTGLLVVVAFYSGIGGAEILPTNTAETQVFTVNNVPVVDIARPTPSGVSKNQFNDFDVDSAGVVINNSLVNGTSRLAGGLGANANFNDKSARIILNEVVTTNTSDINGLTEIFGDDASYILSNPNGISCNGCGFIRTPTVPGDNGTSLSEVFFTTGTATLGNGNTPLAITVDTNSAASIVIGPGGLDASHVDVTTLFTRRAQIQGIIDAANQLRLLAGTGRLEIENDVAAENRTLSTTQSGDGAVSVAIDATVAGAMNAGQIFIQATEYGVGVTLDNDLISTTGDIEITAEGEIRYKNASAAGNVTVSTHGAGSDIGERSSPRARWPRLHRLRARTPAE